tara:strand:- start:1293 stop:4196 length:2904 start_codon:yes stop_codon:yes gene_type:complete
MTSRKYLKFGLRADKNLSDLSDPGLAVGNLLDNLASGQNLLGLPFGFTTADILPLRNLSSTDLIDIIDPESNLPKILIDMEGSVTTFDADAIENFHQTGSQTIQPQITLQDYINRFKVVLGDPPFLQGGSGPFADYVHPSRVTNITGDISNFTVNLDPLTNSNHDLVVGNKYVITTLGSDINQTNWNNLAGTTTANYANGTVFTADDTVANVLGNVNTDAVVRDVTTPSANFASPGDAISANNLPSDVLWTRIISPTLPNVIRTVNDWPEDYGEFEWPGQLHSSFSLDYGLVQFTGYQVGTFNPTLLCNGLIIVEEDVVDNGTENNWRFIRGTNSTTVIPTYPVSIGEVLDDGVAYSRVQFTNENDWRRVGIGMKVSRGASEVSYVQSTSASDGVYTVILASNIGEVVASTTDISFHFELGEDIRYDKLDITRPRGELRRRVRYTIWWPEQINVSKVFRDSSTTFEFDAYDFYKEQLDPTFVAQRFSYPYFRDNRANVLKQKGKTEIQIDSKFVNTYQRDNNAKNLLEAPSALPDYSVQSVYSLADSIEVTVDESGKVVPVTSGDLANAYLGDYLVTSYYDTVATEQKYFSFQIRELDYGASAGGTVGDDPVANVFVSDEYAVRTGLSSSTVHKAVLVRNNGLLGIYKTTTTNAGNNEITIEKTDEGTLGDGTTAKMPFEIEPDTLVYKVNDGPFVPVSDGQGGFTLNTGAVHSTHAKAFRVLTVDHDNDRTASTANLTLEANPVLANSAETNVTADNGILLAYANRGLIDRSAVEECTGVYGKEVTTLVSPGDSQIVLKDTTGISVGDFIYFDGVIPYDNTSTSTMTRVKQVVNSTTIEMGNGGTTPNNAVTIPAGKSLNPGMTVVFVPYQAGTDSDGWGMLNKEYCIIPLNTAPPWDSTDTGLASPSYVPSGQSIPKSYSVMAKEFRYTSLEFVVPDVNLTPYGTENNQFRKRYLEVKYVPPAGN